MAAVDPHEPIQVPDHPPEIPLPLAEADRERDRGPSVLGTELLTLGLSISKAMREMCIARDVLSRG